tara:strand:+ start:1007 stop:1531 length:525 start_codon:yes stop_codon:yes gene_type:complete
MILLSNHLLTLPEFNGIDDVVIRINMAYVKDIFELEKFVSVEHDIFLDYPKGRTKPPKPVLHIPDALDMMKKYENIKYFAVSNIENVSEVNMLCDIIPSGVNFVPKIETLKGVLNLEDILNISDIKYIMFDSEDLYTDVNNDVDLYQYLGDRVKKVCIDYNVDLLELYGVVFNG